jgi:hypothetical protein
MWEKTFISFYRIDLAFIKATLLMEFFNGKFAIKHFPFLLGHFDTTMGFFSRKSQVLHHWNAIEGGLCLLQLHFG